MLLLYPMMANFLLMGCAMPFVYHAMPALHLGGTALMAALGFVAALCNIAAYRTGSAVVVAPMQYSQILWAVVYGYVFFGETPGPVDGIGAAIIIASGMYVVFREDSGPASSHRPVLFTEAATSPAPTRGSARCSRLFRKGRNHRGAIRTPSRANDIRT